MGSPDQSGSSRSLDIDDRLDTSLKSDVSNVTSNDSLDLIGLATRNDGSVDYDLLRTLFRDQRHKYRERLDREKMKRVALEDLLEKYGRKCKEKMKNGKKPRDSSRNSTSFDKENLTNTKDSDSSSTVDTSDLLLELVRRQLHKDKLKSNKRSLNQTPDRSDFLVPLAIETPSDHGSITPTREKFYESTCLFTLPPPPPGMSFVHFPTNNHKPKQPAKSWWISLDSNQAQPQDQQIEPLATGRVQFISRSRHRLRRIATASALRHERDTQLRALAEDVAMGRRSLDEVDLIVASSSLLKHMPAAFNAKQMARQSKLKFMRCPEFLENELKMKRHREYATNRICAKLFQQRIVYENLLATSNKPTSFK